MNKSTTSKRVRCACLPCRKGKLGCEEARPCSKCRHRGIPEQCVSGNSSSEDSLSCDSSSPSTPISFKEETPVLDFTEMNFDYPAAQDIEFFIDDQISSGSLWIELENEFLRDM